MSRENKEAAINKKIDELDLRAYTDKLSGTLLGASKRKLSVVMTIFGNPRIVFLNIFDLHGSKCEEVHVEGDSKCSYSEKRCNHDPHNSLNVGSRGSFLKVEYHGYIKFPVN